MNCSEVRDLAWSHLSGEPLPEDIRTHLETCPGCQRAVAENLALDERVRAGILAQTLDTKMLERRVMRTIARESAPPARRIWGWAVAGAAIAAGLIVTVVEYRPTPPSALFADAADDHKTEVIDHQPRRWRTDMKAAEPLAKYEGVSMSLASAIAGTGYKFKEAKLCRLNGLIFLHLVYTDRGKDFSVFLRRGEGTIAGRWHWSGSGKSIYTSEAGAQQIAGFTDGSLKALVVADQAGDQALRIARAAAKVI